MDTSKLQIGQAYKYTELCKLVNEKTKSGNSKPSQLEEWSRFFRYEEVKGTIKTAGYKILEIYPTPVEKQMRDLSENLEQLSTIFLDDPADRFMVHSFRPGTSDVCEIFLRKRDIYVDCGLVYEDFYKNKTDLIEGNIDDFSHITKLEVDSFYSKVNKILSDAIRDLLKALAKRKIIVYEETLQVIDAATSTTRFVTFKEKTTIKTDIEYHLLRELGLSSKQGLFFSSKRSEFYRKRNELIAKRFNLHDAQDGFRIGFTSDIEEKIKTYKKEIGLVNANKRTVNGRFCAKAKTQAAKEYEKFLAEYKEYLVVPQETEETPPFVVTCAIPLIPKPLGFQIALYSNKKYLQNFNTLVDTQMRLPEDDL